MKKMVAKLPMRSTGKISQTLDTGASLGSHRQIPQKRYDYPFMQTSTPLPTPFAAAALAAAALCATAPALAQPARIAVVNSELILRDSQPARQAQNSLAQEFAERDGELQDTARKIRALGDKLGKDAAVLTDPDRQRRQREVVEMTASSSASSVNSERTCNSAATRSWPGCRSAPARRFASWPSSAGTIWSYRTRSM